MTKAERNRICLAADIAVLSLRGLTTAPIAQLDSGRSARAIIADEHNRWHVQIMAGVLNLSYRPAHRGGRPQGYMGSGEGRYQRQPASISWDLIEGVDYRAHFNDLIEKLNPKEQ